MIKVAIIGAGGRMGRRLVANVMAAEDMELSGSLEAESCPFAGQDAGLLAGCGEAGVKIVTDPEQAIAGADAVINFGTANILGVSRIAVDAGAAVVIGTTAIEENDRRALTDLAKTGARIVIAPNMSVGVNLLFHLASEVARILDDSFDVEVVEMHHSQKKDAPSGTAVKLAEIICEARGLDYGRDVRHGRAGMVGARTRHEVGMHALRGGDVVGDHTVIFAANGERVELTHKASSRDTFAFGALRAVRFLLGVEGGRIYDMQDVLNLK